LKVIRWNEQLWSQRWWWSSRWFNCIKEVAANSSSSWWCKWFSICFM